MPNVGYLTVHMFNWICQCAFAKSSASELTIVHHDVPKPTSTNSDSPRLEQRTLQGHPFVCGWQQLRPKGFSEHVPYAFIQPNGSWCWSNAGFLAPLSDQPGLLVDTLMDPVLTNTMLQELKPATGVGGGQGSIGAAWKEPKPRF